MDAARTHRQSLASNKVLFGLQAVQNAADAAKLGVKVFRKDASDNLVVGMFEIPALSVKIVMPPKSMCKLR